MSSVVGYVNPVNVRAGEQLDLHLSAAAPLAVTARVVRLRASQEAHPDRKALRESQSWSPPSAVNVVPQALRPGSSMTSALDGATTETLSFAVWVLSTLKGGGQQVIGSLSGDKGTMEVSLEGGRVTLAWRPRGRVGDLATHKLSVPVDDLAGRWCYLIAGLDGATRVMSLRVGFVSAAGRSRWIHAELTNVPIVMGALQTLCLAARPDVASAGHFTGRLAGPVVMQRTLPRSATPTLDLPAGQGYGPDDDGVILYYDFAIGQESTTVVELVRGCHGRLINRPTRGLRGPSWSPGSLDFRTDADKWSAAHFHADDMDDAGWEVSHSVLVPDDARSGVYGFVLEGSDEVFPFFITPAAASTARVAFLAPTNTYLAYGNERLGAGDRGKAHEKMMAAGISLSRTEQFAHDHPEFGLSLYDTHLDRSGVSTASWRRPIPNFTPDGVNWLTASPRHLAADLFITSWLEHLDVDFDVLTDADVHLGGEKVLSRYEVLITGTHPEYPSTAEVDAVAAYVRAGGNLMYLGGNGFYWATAFPPGATDVIECRRGSAAQRNWTSAPGEAHLAFTGEPGGAHHHLGRSPRELLGVLSVGAGWGPAVGYIAGEHAQDASLAWIFDGLSGAQVIGDEGFMLGGAAGDEVDSADYEHGTPSRTRSLLRSLPLGEKYYPFLDSVMAVEPGQVATVNPNVRSDVVLVPGEDGAGSVFSVGSICWAGAMAWRHYDNDVARLTTNVLRRFAPAASTDV